MAEKADCPQSTRPNVLVLFADQMRGDTLGCLGHPCVRTPHIDSLAHGGVLFRNGYTPNPICVPARAAFTTGNYPHRCTGSKNNSGRIGPEQTKIAELFAAHGYRTYAAGKLHYVPYAEPGTPRLVHGFQRVALHESGRIIAQFDPRGAAPGLEDYHDDLRQAGWDGYARAHGVGNNDIHPAPSPLPPELYADAWVCRRALAFLAEHRRDHPAAPFLLLASFPKPHAPYDPPRPYDSLVDPRTVPAPLQAMDEDCPPRTLSKQVEARTHGWDLWSPQCHRVARAHYYGQVMFQDAQIGRLLDALRQTGQLDNTIVVYTADHGDLLGDFGFFAKSCFYKGSVQIPFIIHWPQRLQRGVRSASLVGLQDLLPTLAALTGIRLPQAVDGMDLSALLRGEPGAAEREYFVAQCQDAPQQLYMVADRRWKYLYSEVGGTEELYDLEQDPDELRNRAGRMESAAVLAEMRQRLTDWAHASGDTAILGRTGFAVNRQDILSGVTFRAATMGWRWH